MAMLQYISGVAISNRVLRNIKHCISVAADMETHLVVLYTLRLQFFQTGMQYAWQQIVKYFKFVFIRVTKHNHFTS